MRINKYLAECEDQIVKAVNSSGYSELFIKLLLEMFIHLNNEDSAISPVIIKDLETCFFGDYVYYFGEHSLHIFDSKIEHDEVHAAKLFELFEAMFENKEFELIYEGVILMKCHDDRIALYDINGSIYQITESYGKAAKEKVGRGEDG